MNYFIEGVQGSGKTTLLSLMKQKEEDGICYPEGCYNPAELTWCSLLSKEYDLKQEGL